MCPVSGPCSLQPTLCCDGRFLPSPVWQLGSPSLLGLQGSDYDEKTSPLFFGNLGSLLGTQVEAPTPKK